MRSKNHMQNQGAHKIRTYCAQCYNNCPVVAVCQNGEFQKVLPDKDHPFFRPLCPKGHAGPEMVSSSQRILHPLKRTRPKGSNDPGWVRISWQEALQTISQKMKEIKEQSGPEAFAFSQTNVSSPIWEITSFVRRLANLFGTPNHMTTTHICNWHRDNGSALTFGKPGDDFAAGWPDFKNTKSILIWGHNPKNTFNVFNRQINQARKNKAKLIVVDPRRTEIAKKADLWLQVKPGADGALALGMIHLMLNKGLYDEKFVRNWTNAPLLVRCDTGDLLSSSQVESGSDAHDSYYGINTTTQMPISLKPGSAKDKEFILEGKTTVLLADGQTVAVKTVFKLLKEAVASYSPEYTEQVTGIPAKMLDQAVRMITENSPACWYSFNGVEQNLNATQTNRGICTFYALTGDYDKKGGNVLSSPVPPLAFPFGFEFITPQMFGKNLALKKHPLGPAGTIMAVPPYLICRAIEKGDPYKIRGLMVFGANTVSANPHSKITANALAKLEFHVQVEHFLSPTAQLADIVLPAASFWESGRIGYTMNFSGNQWSLQWREPVADPRGESKDELWIIFQLAERLGFTEQFWGGDIEAAFESMLEPTGIRLDELRRADGGVFLKRPLAYQKYLENGFKNLTGRVELFSQHLKNIHQSPLPEWNDPQVIFRQAGIAQDNYPFLLINAKLREYCQSQHRGLPSLRKRKPHPYVEINKAKALSQGIADGDSVTLETVNGRITTTAKLTEDVAPNVVCTQHGWWQSCPELGLPGHDIYSAKGANVNLLYKSDYLDPISGSIHMRGFPCNITKN
ncbi:molybdopterin-containing oxidoreductase family protein [Dethiosulfatarculus sandiegensis]|uniref:4Fe-4S Mo/W bis-MGD-type domain-containing protein n=1 Tax=Dethiosulfatarculus sandiegensis TaxID=1429043 RepID=A0A0D2JFI1_9BACT|nr:molybdopterin-dependent oxidoreductase [Dethiosulfatarculus sandiegensis]KIX14466.1 hypothetical protein X474_10285 [Dethiosulfatarculus sandiegensis]